MVDTSYNPDFAPFVRAALQQAPIPTTVHNVPSSIAANGSVQSSLIVTEGYTLISAGITLSQAGTVSVQRYIDAGGSIPQGSAVSVNLSANTANNLNVTDGLPFASFKLTVTNSGGSAATISNFALLVQMGQNAGSGGGGGGGGTVSVSNFPASQAVTGTFWQATQPISGSVSVSNFPATQTVSGTVGVSGTVPVSGTFWQTTQPVSITSGSSADGSTTITTGGTAQNLFGGTTPTNGFAICNPDPTNDLWVSDSATAAANGTGCFRVVANGGYYATETGQKPLGAVSIVGAVTGQKITARRW